MGTKLQGKQIALGMASKAKKGALEKAGDGLLVLIDLN